MEPGITMITKRVAVMVAALIPLLMFTAAEAANKFYKWTDDAGVIHYGEIPPDPSKAQVVNVHTGSSADEEKAMEDMNKSRAKAEDAAGQQTEASAKGEMSEENAKIMKENCKVYKQNLSALKNSARIREKDAKGEYRYLTEEEKAAREKDADTYIKENCQ